MIYPKEDFEFFVLFILFFLSSPSLASASVPESVELELFLLRVTGESHPLCEGDPPFTKGDAGGDGDIRSSLSKSLSAQDFGERFPGNGTCGSPGDGFRGGGTPFIGTLVC